MTGFDRYPLDKKDIDNALRAFGKILVSTDDVYRGNIYLTGKKENKDRSKPR